MRDAALGRLACKREQAGLYWDRGARSVGRNGVQAESRRNAVPEGWGIQMFRFRIFYLAVANLLFFSLFPGILRCCFRVIVRFGSYSSSVATENSGCRVF